MGTARLDAERGVFWELIVPFRELDGRLPELWGWVCFEGQVSRPGVAIDLSGVLDRVHWILVGAGLCEFGRGMVLRTLEKGLS